MSIRWSGGALEIGAAPEGMDPAERRILVRPAPRGGALALLVEGVPPEEREPLCEGIRAALERDRGTPSSRLLRAVSAGCRRLEAQALHRFELAALGLTAFLIEEGAAHLIQLLPSQAYVVEDGQVRALPEEPMRGAARVASQRGRRWEVEIDVNRFGTRPGSAFVLCTAGLAERLTPAKVLEATRRPVNEAAAALQAIGGGGRTASDGSEEALVARVVGSAERPRARLSPMRERRAPRRSEPLLPGSGPPIESWGLPGAARTPLRGRYGDPLPALGSRRRTRRAVWLPAAGAVAAAAIGGVWWARSRAPLTPAAQTVHAPPSAATPSAAPGPGSSALLVSTGEPLTSLAVAGGVARVLDGANRIVQPGGAPAAPAGVGQILALAARDGDVIALDVARTVWRLGEGAEPARPLALRAASLWQRPRAIATYAGNLYVLDAGSAGSAGQIWRHAAGAGGGFDGDAQAWLLPSAAVNLDGATAMAIDGAIWISRNDGQVLRLFGGRPEPYEPRGLDVPIRVAGAVYTDVALGAVYVLDSAERRLLKLAKTGQLEQSVPDAIPLGEHARGLWVDETGRRALVLTDRRLQEVPLI